MSGLSFEQLVAQGHERRRAGDKAGSLASFQAAYQANSLHLGAQVEIVNGLRELGRFDEASTAAQRAIEEHPNAPLPRIALALVKRGAKDRAAALAAFEAAIAVAPDHPGAHLEMATELRALGQTERADTVIEDISQRRPDVAGAAVRRQPAEGNCARRRLVSLSHRLPTNQKPFGMAFMIAEKYGLSGRWTKAQIAWGRSRYEATMTRCRTRMRSRGDHSRPPRVRHRA